MYSHPFSHIMKIAASTKQGPIISSFPYPTDCAGVSEIFAGSMNTASRFSTCSWHRGIFLQTLAVPTPRSRDSDAFATPATGGGDRPQGDRRIRPRRDHTETTPARDSAAATAATTACSCGVGLVARPSGSSAGRSTARMSGLTESRRATSTCCVASGLFARRRS
jgi:hypothetical protein